MAIEKLAENLDVANLKKMKILLLFRRTILTILIAALLLR